MKRLAMAGLVLLAGCGYFNALYNAERRFDEAERAAARGERNRAADRYQEAIEHAAVSYRGHPDSRWADDALYLIVRARFGRAEYREAAVASDRLVEIAQDEETRLGAQAYRGASLVRLDSAAQAVPALDVVAAATRADRQLGAFARLWRARAHFKLGASEQAWADLEEAQRAEGPLAVEALLEAATRALASADSVRLRSAVAGLLAEEAAVLRRDTVTTIARAGARRWDGAFAASLLDAPTEWRTAARDSVAITRAELAGRAGDVDRALETLVDIYERNPGATGYAARRTAAQLMLARATVADLDEIRAVLLPAVIDPVTRDLVRDLQVVTVLAARGRAGQPLALFAAGEHARDRLRALSLARSLFLEYADMAAGAEWAPKAILAALALVDDDAQRDQLLQRLESSRSNVYVAAHRGELDAAAVAAAEERLASVVSALQGAALAEAGQRDVAIDRAIAIVDSIQTQELTDSMTLHCGAWVDSLAIVGIRADSLRAACVRSDTARVSAVLVIDTMELVDTTGVAVDSFEIRMRGADPRPDTAAVR